MAEPGPSSQVYQTSTALLSRRRRARVGRAGAPRGDAAYTWNAAKGSKLGPSADPYSAGEAQIGASASWLEARKYAILIDAGSSGSRMQVYSWRDPKLDRAVKESKGQDVKTLPKVEKGTWEGSGTDWSLKAEPGLSSFGDHPYDLGAYLKPLMDHAEKIVPQSAWADTPIYILATAGMRLLPEDQRDAVLAESCRYIKEHTSFSIDGGGCDEHVQVISGEEEGMLGWIAINYLMDGFHIRGNHQVIGADTDVVEGKSTFGFLDMGGASTQIAFEPSPKVLESEGQAAQEELTPVVLRMLDGTEVSHKVFVTTFLGYGTNQARERYIKELKSNGTTVEVNLHDGSFRKMLPDPCLPSGLRLDGAGKDHKAALVGTGSFTSCLELTHPLLDKNAECSKPPCLFHGVHVPAIDFSVNHFIGVSEYWFSSNDVFGQGGVYDFVSFQKAAEDFCAKPWSELKQHLDAGDLFGPQVELDRLQLQCFKAAWMTTVLHEGIGLPRIVDSKGTGDGRQHINDAQDKADQKNLFQSVNDVDGFTVSWTLGKAVLEATRDIPAAPGLLPSPLDQLPSKGGSSGFGGWGPLRPSWPTTGEGSAFPPSLPTGRKGVPPTSLIVMIVTFVLLLLLCLCTRGRSPRASRRRAAIKELLPPPLGSFGGLWPSKRTGGRGDYVLASMEEAMDKDGAGGKWGGFGLRGKQVDGLAGSTPEYEAEVSYSSEGSSEESGGSGRARTHRRKKSNPTSGLLGTLAWPVRRVVHGVAQLVPWSRQVPSKRNKRDSNLIMGTRTSAGITTGRIPVRRGATSPTLVRVSRPGSPSFAASISRPASRTSSRAPTPVLGHRAPRTSISQAPLGRPGLFSASISRTNSTQDFSSLPTISTTPVNESSLLYASGSRVPSRVGSPTKPFV